MFETIVKSGIPLISLTTRDTVNIFEVLQKLCGRDPVKFSPAASGKFEPNTIYYLVMNRYDKPYNFSKHYAPLANKESTLLVINYPHEDDVFFDAGELPVPKDMLESWLTEVTKDPEHVTSLVRALGGVTLKEAAELICLATTEDQALTTDGVMRTRKEYFQSQAGLFLIDSDQPLYIPVPELESWVEKEKSFFMDPPDFRLMPRGVLFDGPPGTGKTAGAKFISQKWGIPVYRIDIGSTKDKYVGASENRMRANLARLDREEPCIALFDEMEKMFSSSESSDGNTTSSMMSQVLWWLAEHKTRVLTVMTTNDMKKLPPELYREGRIDTIMTFEGLTAGPAEDFVKRVAATFGVELDSTRTAKALKDAFSESDAGDKASQAMLTSATYTQVKQALLQS